MPFTTRDARPIHYSVVGDGPTVVLVPGLGSGMKLFGTLPRRFARDGFRCVAFDPVGVEPSSPHEGRFEFDAAADDLLAVAAAVDDGQVHLVGTSLGGKVALAANARDPGRIRSLTLLASSAVVTPRARRIYRFFEIVAAHLSAEQFAEVTAPFLFGRTFHRERPSVVDDIVRALRPTAERRAWMVAQSRALQDYDGSPAADRVSCPTLCVAGDEDTLTSVDEVEATAARIAGATFVRIPDAGHTLLLESASVYDAVVAHLRAPPVTAAHLRAPQ
jgi:3-oxoadipate enol-lactonase